MIILKKKDSEGEYLQMQIGDDATWVDVTDRFVEFLQGCGYIVQGIDVAEHLMTQYGFQKKEREQCQDTTVKKAKSKK